MPLIRIQGMQIPCNLCVEEIKNSDISDKQIKHVQSKYSSIKGKIQNCAILVVFSINKLLSAQEQNRKKHDLLHLGTVCYSKWTTILYSHPFLHPIHVNGLIIYSLSSTQIILRI